MTRASKTRSALFTSIISLLLCVSMLVGTTFAWFTDTAATGLNKIVAGNLDVELWDAEDKNVEGTTKLFTVPELWEPGAVAYAQIKVANVGSLALKASLSINYEDVNSLNGHVLSEVLKYAIIDASTVDMTSRAEVLAAAKKSDNVGSLSIYDFTLELEAGKTSDVQTLVIFWEPNDDETDNLFNANNGQETSDGKPLQIELGVTVFATQLVSEEDSFGPDYDEGAPTISKEEFGNMINSGEESVDFYGNTVEYMNSVTISASNISNMNSEGIRYGYLTGNTVFEDCTFIADETNDIRAFHIDDVNGGGTATLTFRNCTFAGWIAISGDVTDVYFENCTFADDRTYNFINSYQNMTFTNCTFEEGFTMDDESEAQQTWTFDGCTGLVEGTLNLTGSKDTVTIKVDEETVELTEVASGLIYDKVDTYTIVSKEGLYSFADQVNTKGETFSGETVVLATDVDLANEAWTPIGSTGSTTFSGSFDGNGHTIRNLNVDTTGLGRENAAAAGLFGWIENHSSAKPTVISNLTIDGVTVNSGKHAGAVAGYLGGGVTIDNCDVKNAVISGTRAAAVVGYQNPVDTIKNCDVVNAEITGSVSFGEICGYSAGTVANCTSTNVTMTISGQEALDYAISNGMTTINLADSTYNLNNVSMVNKTITFSGSKDAIIDMTSWATGYATATGANLTFEGVTMKWLATENYQGFTAISKLTYKDCAIDGLQFLYGETVFENCTLSNEQCWAVWTYTSKNVTFTGCTFETGGHAVLVYNEGTNVSFENNITFTDCVFNNSGLVNEQWGHEDLVETGCNASANGSASATSNKYNLTFTNCTVTGSNKQALWGNKNNMDTEHLNVIVNGVDVH